MTVNLMTMRGMWLTKSIAGFMTLLTMCLTLPGAMAQDTSSFKVFNEDLPTFYIRHSNFITELTNFNLDDATFIIRPALDGTPRAVSFEASNPQFRGFYLRHDKWQLVLSDSKKPAHPESFRADASFITHPGFVGGDKTVTYEASNSRNKFIYHNAYKLWVGEVDPNNMDKFHKNASFFQTPPLAAVAGAEKGDTSSFKVFNEDLPTFYIRHSNFITELTNFNLDDATFIIRPALDGTPRAVSFEASNPQFRGFYLRHDKWQLVLSDSKKPAHPESFRADASFITHPGFVGGDKTVTYEASNSRNKFIYHNAYKLWVGEVDPNNMDKFHKNASFFQTPPLAAVAGAAQAVVTVALDVEVYDAPDGNGQKIGELTAGTKGVTLVENKVPWFHVKWPAGEGWVYSGDDFESLKLP